MKNWRMRLEPHQLDLAAALGLFILALAVRLPNLYLIPRFTDEVVEWDTAWQIANGAHSPFEGVQLYFGPLILDLWALLFKVLPSPYVPRAGALLAGALTVVAAYALGRILGGRAVGVIAGLLMASASTHITVTSHIAYSNSFTPLFVTVTLICLALARRRESGIWLTAAAVFYGLALHTHPFTVTLAPSLAAWFLLPRTQWSWFRRPSLYVSALALAAASSPVWLGAILHLDAFSGSVITRSYAFAIAASPSEYLGNVQNLTVELARMQGAVYPNLPSPRHYLSEPLVLLYLLLAPVAAWAVVRKRVWLLPAAIVPPMLLIPSFNRQYGDFPYFTRYLAFLLPPIYTAAALGVVELVNVLSARVGDNAKLVIRGLGVVGVVLLCILPLNAAAEWYASQVRGGRTNALFFEIVGQVGAHPQTPLWIDDSLSAGEFPSGGSLGASFQTWFTLSGREWRASPRAGSRREVCRQPNTLVIASAQAAERLRRGCLLEELIEGTIPTRPGRAALTFGLYRVR